MELMKRAVATFTVYVYGESEEELKNEVQKHIQNLNNVDIECQPECVNLTTKPFGSIDPIDMVEIKLP